MDNERMQALGRVESLKKELIDVGVKAGSHFQSISFDFNTIITQIEWQDIDTEKIIYLAKTIKNLQKEYHRIIKDLKLLQEKYGIE